MSEGFRNIADVIDRINDFDKVYVTHTEHEGEPDDYGTFELVVEVPQYQRIEQPEDNE